jgi:hypothetical protein
MTSHNPLAPAAKVNRSAALPNGFNCLRGPMGLRSLLGERIISFLSRDFLPHHSPIALGSNFQGSFG